MARDLTSSTNSPARAAGSAKRSLTGFRRAEQDVSRAGIHPTLLLMRLDSGSFTPDQVEWVARALDEWVAPLSLIPPPGTGANF